MRRAAVWIAALCAAASAAAQGGAPLGADEIAARVGEIYFEGYPVADQSELSADAVARLGAMLVEPAQEPYWSNVVLALGASGRADALVHLEAFAAREPAGEVSGALYAARASLPVALGMLAHTRPRAYALLAAMARDARSERGWRFQSLRGGSLNRALRNAALTGLAVSGRPEATAVFDELAAAHSADAALVRHLDAMRTVHARARERGPRSVMAGAPAAQP